MSLFAGVLVVTGEVLECQLLAAPAYSHVPSKSWFICKGHFSTNFTHSEWECIPAGRSNHSEGSFWQLCACIAPRPTRGTEGQCRSAGTCSHAPLGDGPSSLQLLSSSSPTDSEGVLKPSTEVCGLEGEKECCSKFVLFIYGFIFTSGFACCPYRWKQSWKFFALLCVATLWLLLGGTETWRRSNDP